MRKTTVRLPSDGLTEAQKRRMNGPMHEYKMNEPMSVHEFKRMPDDLKVEYVRGLNSRFGVGPSTIGVELFGRSRPWLGELLKEIGAKIPRGGKLARQQRYEWEKWLDGVEHVSEPPKEIKQIREEPSMVLESATVRFVGELTATSIVQALSKIRVPMGEKCVVCIYVCRQPEGV